jgi:hypothetical protein
MILTTTRLAHTSGSVRRCSISCTDEKTRTRKRLPDRDGRQPLPRPQCLRPKWRRQRQQSLGKKKTRKLVRSGSKTENELRQSRAHRPPTFATVYGCSVPEVQSTRILGAEFVWNLGTHHIVKVLGKKILH